MKRAADIRSSLKPANRPRILFDRQLSGIGAGHLTADTIGRALDGRRSGRGWQACCPAHDDRTPSLSIDSDEGMVLVRCHAGCDQTSVISALRALGLWPTSRRRAIQRRSSSIGRKQQRDDPERTAAALAIWQGARSANSTLVETYLRSRGIATAVSEQLRFHPGPKHPSGDIWPAMVALITRGVDGMPVAIHRTFLAVDGCAKAPVDPQRMSLGPCRSGVVRLAPAAEILMVGEGVETCLSAMMASGLPAWAALSTSGLRALDLPDHIRDVIVLADGDAAGKAAARNCAFRWTREGRRVRVARPPAGMDFNDMLVADPNMPKERSR